MMKRVLKLSIFCLFCAVFFSSLPLLAAEKVVTESEEVSLTVYNQNFALVRDQRAVNLSEGINYLRVENIAAYIDPSTVGFTSLTAPEAVVVREQNYQYDLINPTNVLNKSVGKRMTIRQVLEDGTMRTIEGTLMNPVTVVLPAAQDRQPWYYQYGSRGYASVSGPISVAGLVIKTDDGIILNLSGEIMLAELPEGLISKPSLLWKLESTKAGAHRTELSYLTEGLNWRADYVARVNATDDRIELTGWVTLENRSGARYENAGLQLIAGDVRRLVARPEVRAGWGYGGVAPMGAPPPQFEEKPFFEYHLYTLKEKTTISDNETKQLSLLSAHDVPVKKVLVYDGAWLEWRSFLGGSYSPWLEPGRPGGAGATSPNKKINVMVELVNSEENNMGIPLPKGIVRVYKADEEERLQFVGDDEIDHTTKDEKIRLWLGNAFDIVGERKMTDYTVISHRVDERSFEISLRNHKEEAVEIEVVEHIPWDWKMLENSHDFYEKDANTIVFPVKVGADEEVKVTYRVRITKP